MLITHAFQFTDEAAAKAALPQFTADDGIGGKTWDTGYCDPGIPISAPTGTFTTDPTTGITTADTALVAGWFMNVALPALDVTLPGLTGAWTDPGELLFGTKPKTPQRVFA